jgi:hypothetical protein
LNSTTTWLTLRAVNGSYTQVASGAADAGCPTAGGWSRVSVVMVGTQMKVLCNEARAAPASGWSSMGTNHTSGSVGIRTNGVPAGQSLNIDDVVVRRCVDAEPVVAGGAEDLN